MDQMEKLDEMFQGRFDEAYAPFISEIFEVDTLERKPIYAAFYEKYNAFVTRELQKRNKLTQNFEDLHARIWVDFSGSATGMDGLIEKFFRQAAESAPELPRTMMASEAAKLLNVTVEELLEAFNRQRTITGEELAACLDITFHKWRTANWRSDRGAKVVQEDGTIVRVRGRYTFPKPIEGSYQSRFAVYSRADVLAWHQELEAREPNRKGWRLVNWGNDYPSPPSPVEGEVTSPEAVYNTEGIESWFEAFEQNRHLMGELREGAWVFQVPRPRATKKHFMNYLKRCIANRFANFCRYEKRRHQERVWDTFADQRSQLEDPAPWEDRQEVPSNQEEGAELSLLIARLERTPAASHVKAIVLSMYDDGYSLREAINKVSELTAEQKRTTIRDVCDRRPVPHAVVAA